MPLNIGQWVRAKALEAAKEADAKPPGKAAKNK
jgi:hypothetical protein